MNDFTTLENQLQVDGVFAVKVRPISVKEIKLNRDDLLDKIAQEVGCKPLGRRWRKLVQKEGVEFIENLFEYDIAYKDKRDGVVDGEYDPTGLTLLFLEVFDGHIDYYTNVMANPIWASNYSWNSTTNWTFDCTMIAVGSKHIGLICFADED